MTATTNGMDETHRDALARAVEHVARPGGMDWLRDVCGQAPGVDAERLSAWSAAARRKLGATTLDADALLTDAGPVTIAGWEAGDAARTLLADAACGTSGAATVLDGLFRRGDERERAHIVRSLGLFPPYDATLEIAYEVGRANSVDLFGALALANPYPATAYPEHMFNQLVLKGLFLGLDVRGIPGLARRANADLSRMCADFVEEREAAGRAVPPSMWAALGPHADARGLAMLERYSSHDDPEQRQAAADALAARITH